MQVPYGEGVATRIGPEPCADVRKGAGEASAGECTGQPLNRERPIIPGADTVPNVEGHTHGCAICERPDDPAWSQTLASTGCFASMRMSALPENYADAWNALILAITMPCGFNCSTPI